MLKSRLLLTETHQEESEMDIYTILITCAWLVR